MNGPKEGGSMLAGMTTPVIVPIYPIRQLSDPLYWKESIQISVTQIAFSSVFGIILSLWQT
jgi:hypothetical protein